MNVLVINAGSSSLKYQLINVETHTLMAKGICERVGSAEAFHKHGLDDNEVVIDAKMADHDDAMALVLESLVSGQDAAIASLSEIDAVGHRIVQGGKYFDRSVLIDDDVIAKIDELKYCSMPENMLSSFSAPELFSLLGTIEPTTDIYSVGMILYRIYNGNHGPFEDEKTSARAADKS